MSKKCTPLWCEAHFQVKSVKKPTVSDHFWKLRCRKSAHRCGAKHISKSKVSKTYGLRPLFDVQMSKMCTPLWRDAHFQVKSVKNCGFCAVFDVQMSKKWTSLWRDAHFQVKSVKNCGFCAVFDVKMSKQ